MSSKRLATPSAADFTNLVEFGTTKLRHVLSDDQMWKWMGVAELWHIVIEYWATWPPMFEPIPSFIGCIDGKNRQRLTIQRDTGGWWVAYGMHPIKSLNTSLTVKALRLEPGAFLAVGVARQNILYESVELTPSYGFYVKSFGNCGDPNGIVVHVRPQLSLNRLTIDAGIHWTPTVFPSIGYPSIPNLRDCFLCVVTDKSGTIVELLSDD